MATTPGLNLTDPKPLGREHIEVLSAGLSEGVQGFPPLPNAAEDMDAIGGMYKAHRLLNQEFRVPRLEKEMKNRKTALEGTSLAVSGSLNRPPMPFDDTMKAAFEKARSIAARIGMDLKASGTGGG